MNRREALGTLGTAGLVTLGGSRSERAVSCQLSAVSSGAGRLKQSVCRWPFNGIPLPDFCRAAAAMGIQAIDLLNPDEWAVARDAGLRISMSNTSRRRDFLTSGIADAPMHDTIMRELEEVIPRARAFGIDNVIVLSGNRRGRQDAEGVAHCVTLLQRAVPLAAANNVTIFLEMLNSRVDHRDHFADTTAFGVAVSQGVNSPHFKLLYDIYHMQIMEGNVIATIRQHASHIGHIHTAGVPGRHELDQAQELNYRAIAQVLADMSFGGFVAHEFIPTRDPLTGLREAYAVCDV